MLRCLSIVFFSFVYTNAQIVIEPSDLPQENKSVEIAVSDGFGFDLGVPSEEEQSWDFSFLPFVESKTFSLQTSDDFLGSYAFPEATMAQTTPFADVLGVSLTYLVDLPINLPDANVFYGLNEEGSVNFQGIFTDFDIEGATDGDTASIALEPPFNYYPIGTLGDTIKNQSSFFFKVPVDQDLVDILLGTGFDLEGLGISLEILDAGVTVNVANTVEIDAYGNLTTPKGEYDVLRFNETMFLDVRINAFLGLLDLGEVFNTNAVVKQFRFWAKELHHPVLTVVEFDEQGGTSTLSVEYINEEQEIEEPPVTSIENNISANCKVYPNPVSNLLLIELPDTWSNATACLFDINGKLILTENVNQIDNIEVDGLNSGMYFLELSAKGETINKTFLKQ